MDTIKNKKLFTLLSCYYAFECKLRCYHWNVEGSNFVEYHKYFEDLYDVTAKEIDTIAEQIRKLGERVPATLNNFASTANDVNFDTKNSAEKDQDMIACILASSKELLKIIKDLKLELDGQYEYMGMCVMLDELMTNCEKNIWFLTSLNK